VRDESWDASTLANEGAGIAARFSSARALNALGAMLGSAAAETPALAPSGSAAAQTGVTAA
jgi:hypothetical protein